MKIDIARQIDRLNHNLSDLGDSVDISFEFFPPNTSAMEQTLWHSIERLAPLNPKFVSVTYGAANSTQERTHNVIKKIQNETSLIAVPHLTCVGSSKEKLVAIANDYWKNGIRHIVALKGDLDPQAKTQTEEFYALDLVKLLKKTHDFEISVAAYPEVHPQAPNAAFDLQNLKNKFDAGASRAITQFFFDNSCFLKYRDKCQAIGIEGEIVPGILPVSNFEQLKRFAKMTGVRLPQWMAKQYQGLENDPTTRNLLAANIAIEQVKILASEGVRNFHFYTLNRSDLTYAICHSLGVNNNFEKRVAEA